MQRRLRRRIWAKIDPLAGLDSHEPPAESAVTVSTGWTANLTLTKPSGCRLQIDHEKIRSTQSRISVPSVGRHLVNSQFGAS